MLQPPSHLHALSATVTQAFLLVEFTASANAYAQAGAASCQSLSNLVCPRQSLSTMFCRVLSQSVTVSLPPLSPAPPQLRCCLSQVDGPLHFVAMAGGGWRPNGATLLKRRLLGLVGWSVVSMPYWQWRACAGSEEQKERLRLLLESCCQSVSGAKKAI